MLDEWLEPHFDDPSRFATKKLDVFWWRKYHVWRGVMCTVQ